MGKVVRVMDKEVLIKKKDEGTKVRVHKEALKYLYLFKAETGKPLYEILNAVVKYSYENESVRREIIRILMSFSGK
ncbi:MAG: hypothetical protein QW290_09440 [Sulfolobales archaeon]